MAITDQWAYPQMYTSTTTNVSYPLNLTGTWVGPTTISSDGGSYSAPAPRPQTPLEWLDAEVEATCKLARQAA